MERKANMTALAIYGGISMLAAGAFLAVTTLTGSYPSVARYGGALWILVLSLIVTMPLVIPRVRAGMAPARARVRGPGPDQGAHH
ncbi:MAG: hypothetical protein M5U22_21375 [Thermoleophilia bacterium]|nr:hypothetical protein [Thermoleophilia bacterium]